MRDKPLSTCSRESCNKCGIHSEITCHFTLIQLLRFYLFVLPSFLIGGTAIYNYSITGFISWVLIMALFFLLIGIRVLCSHCPHYNESSLIMRCWANYGVPKFWKFRPQPMSFLEKAIYVSGLIFVWGYPAIFIVLGESQILLVAYVFSVVWFFGLMRWFSCRKCINLSCPLNGVNIKVKEEFLKNNPLINDSRTRQG